MSAPLDMSEAAYAALERVDAIALALDHSDARAALLLAWHRLLRREAPAFEMPVDPGPRPKLRLVK